MPRPQVNVRLDPYTAQLMAALMERLNTTPTSIIRSAIAALAREQGVTVPRPSEADDAD